ncbi:uncharacterized protein LOC143199544 isoform X1 [Rhynchophorus ferrugineus]|uniref:uncharacterized protein LOC143199544 isoform X1 n=1 Tax=Rhynchophorus ferrugineus TaxID=354439 RepID=UPI003FCDC586
MKLYSILVQVGTVRIMGLIYIVFKIYRFLRKRSSFRHILAHLIIGFMYDFVTRYVKLMGRFEEYNSTVTKQCDTSKMSTTEWILFIFSSTNCEKKFVKFSHVLEDQFIELLDLVGNVLNKALRSIVGASKYYKTDYQHRDLQIPTVRQEIKRIARGYE